MKQKTENTEQRQGHHTHWQHFRRYMIDLVNLHEHVDVAAADESIRKNIYFRGPNVLILICAIWIASLGLNINSIPVIIGAMLVSPLMGPIVGLGMGFGEMDMSLIRDSLKNLIVMVAISIIASTIYFVVSPLRLSNPTELLARTNPTIYDVLIAFIGGLAGILETSRREKGTVIAGVAIATALMPPLCTIGFGFSQLNAHYALGAFYLFTINSVFIALATFVGTKYLRFPVKHYADETRQRRMRRLLTVLLVIIITPSLITALDLVRQNNFSRNAEHFLSDNRSVGKSYIYDYKVESTRNNSMLELFLAGEQLTQTDREALYASAQHYGIKPEQLTIREEATGVSVSEQEMVKNLMQSTDQRIKTLTDSITQLHRQFDAYLMPSQQIAQEIAAQYHGVQSVMVMRGDKVSPAEQASSPTVVVLVEMTQKMSDADRERLQTWLRVRLNTEQLELVIRR